MVNTRAFLPLAVLLALAVSAQAHGPQQDRVLTGNDDKQHCDKKKNGPILIQNGEMSMNARGTENSTSTFKSKALNRLEPFKPSAKIDVASWLTEANDVLTQVSTGAFASVETKFLKTVTSISTNVVDAGLIDQQQVLGQVFDLFPSLWKTAFSYLELDVWKPIFSNIFTKCFERAKKCEETQVYDNALQKLSLIIRFTKDNVFASGEDKGDSTGLIKEEYLTFLAELVTSASKVDNFKVDTAGLRAFMNTLTSKKDEMDTNVDFPVFVNTSKYAVSDAKAVETFLHQKA